MAELLFKLPCLTSFPLFLHSLLFSSCLNLLFGTQQKPRRLKPFFCKYEMWDLEEILYLGGFCRDQICFNALSFDTPLS